MVFSSLIFVFAYLPLTLLLYYLVPLKLRNLALFVLSLVFYGWGEPRLILVMVVSIVSAYGFGFGIEKYRDNSKRLAKLFLILSISVNLGILVFFKYYNFLAGALGLPKIAGLSLPIGISFYTFQILSYSIDLYRNAVPLAKNAVDFGTYVTLFPQLIAGPIVRYQDVRDQLKQRKESIPLFAEGVTRFVIGLGKKLILADGAASIAKSLETAAGFEPTVVGTWMIMLFYSFQIYFDFSGYSDMAIGLGKLFGFHFPENFNYPYVAKSITEFWRRWHITLSTWFREYVYIPLGGNRAGKGRSYFNLAVVWLLTGFWHGADWNYLLWGVYFCLFLIVEKAFLRKRLEKHPWCGRLYALLVIGFGWMIFFHNDLGAIWQSTKHLFGIGATFADSSVAYELLRVLPFAAVCAIGCTPLPRRLILRMKERCPSTEFITAAVTMLLFLICVAYMVNNSFSPFLYFIF